jgi:hypothetical protein
MTDAQHPSPSQHDQAELTHMANQLRMLLQDATCCPVAAARVCEVLLATFIIDLHFHDPAAAADAMEEVGKAVADQIRRGAITIVRTNEVRSH